MMKEFAAHEWPAVVAHFDSIAASDHHWVPLRDCVRRLSGLPIASGLYPIASMQTLRLFQHAAVRLYDNELRLDWVRGEFVVRYLAGTGSKRDPNFALTLPPGTWTKRGADGLVLLDRALHHLRWFVEYLPEVGGSA
jgi:hypothetical protein